MFRVFVFLNLWMCIGVAGIKEDAGEDKGSTQDFEDTDNDDYEYLQAPKHDSASTETAVTSIYRRLKMTKPMMTNRTVTDLEDVVYKILARPGLRKKNTLQEKQNFRRYPFLLMKAENLLNPRILYLFDFQFDPGMPPFPSDLEDIQIVYYEHLGSIMGAHAPDVFRFRLRPDARYDMEYTFSEIPVVFNVNGMSLHEIFMRSVEGYTIWSQGKPTIGLFPYTRLPYGNLDFRMKRIKHLTVLSTTPKPPTPTLTPKEWTESCPSKPPGLETIIQILDLKDMMVNETYEYYQISDYVYGTRLLGKDRLQLVMGNRTDIDVYMHSLMIFYDNRTQSFRERYRHVDWLEEKILDLNRGPYIYISYYEAGLTKRFVYDFKILNITDATVEKRSKETMVLHQKNLTKKQIVLRHNELYYDYTSRYWEWRKNELVKDVTTEYPYAKLDMDSLLDIISDLTYDYETNMSLVVDRAFGGTLPTCATTIPELGESTTGKETDIIIAKCYVCGIEQTGIPRDAYCAEAFETAGRRDFKAKGRMHSYRKNCRYLDTDHFELNETVPDPKSEYGRWTGGCAVRWVDISGIYTQRVCRRRNRPVLGNHLVSPRLAKMEKALSLKDTGCIVSPAASLTPLSRGVSLYARYHACVCRGDWCNQAIFITPSHSTILMLSLIYSLFS